MTLNSNGIYTGFIKVQMELCKPTQTSGKLAPGSNGCMNTLHISSTNTVGEVIEALLKKFLVTESPAKFALYKRCHREDQGTWPCSQRKPSLLLLTPCVPFSSRQMTGCVCVGDVRALVTHLAPPGRFLAVPGFELDMRGSENFEASACDGREGRSCDPHKGVAF
uniref:Ras-associating domain-containing protein n=1 Tax=Oryctolagus cuniculus TaxID=9986 RepID=G1TZB7_RABIT